MPHTDHAIKGPGRPAKLSEDDGVEIRRLLDAGFSIELVAVRFNVSWSTVLRHTEKSAPRGDTPGPAVQETEPRADLTGQRADAA